VGVGTVSRVLNDSPRVSTATNTKVRSVIEELGYRRHHGARSLALGRSHAVGVVAPFFTSPSVVERLRGVAERLTRAGYDLVLFDVETPRQRAEAFAGFARPDRIDGLLVVSLPPTPDEVARLRGLPVVLVDVVAGGLTSVTTDDHRGGRLAAEHLLARGHRSFGFIGDDVRNAFGFTSSERRREGYLGALLEAGVPPEDVSEALGPHGRREARSLADALLDLEKPPSAIFAASDVQALGVLEVAAQRGLRVPDDLAVIGFDDVEVAAALGLTTVRQPLFATGARGADLLVAAIEGRPPAELRSTPLEPLRVVARRTT
jgi:DNA-binding LacI/PurR family transcriptional regulator